MIVGFSESSCSQEELDELTSIEEAQDSIIIQRDIFQRLSSDAPGLGRITLNQSPALTEAMTLRYAQNSARPGTSGYVVCIYKGQGRSARAESADLQRELMERYPDLHVYRTFVSPHYLVSVGECRSRFEAFALQNLLRKEFRAAYVISQWINFPSFDSPIEILSRQPQTVMPSL